MKQRRIVFSIILIALPCLMAAAERDAAQSVQEGLSHFEQGQFEEAARAFEKADEATPNDARIAFDRGCTAAAAGDAAGAVALFQQASASTDPKLAAAARYCLGCLAAMDAKKALGEKPQDASPEVRAETLEHLARATEHYRDAIELDPTHDDARYNSETIRHWVKHMKELWRQSDRKKLRDKMNLLDYVLLLEKEQREIRTLSKTLGKQPDTPLLREQLDDVRQAQEYMAMEIEPLKEKVIAALTKPQGAPMGPGGQPGPGGQMMPGGPGGQPMPGAPAQPAVPTADMQKAVALLGGLADQARTEMTTATDQLASARTQDALKAQAAAVEMLDQIYMAVVPYPGLVKRAVDTQRELVGRTTRIVEPPKTGPQPEVDKTQKTADDNTPNDDQTVVEEQPEIDMHEDAWDQKFVTRWSEVMVAKAKQGLKQMPPPAPEEKKDDAKKGDAKKDEVKKDAKPANSLANDKKPADAKPDPAAAAKKKMEGLRKSMELAVKLGPKVETLTDEAATHLDEEQPKPALPKQKEALRLLEEIAKPLQDENNKDQNKQDQQQKQDQKQQQDNKDQKNQDQKNKDQQNKDQKDKKDDQKKKNDQKKDDKDKKDQDKKEQDKKKDDKQKGDKDKDEKKDKEKKDKDKQAGKDKKKPEEKKPEKSPADPKEMKGQKQKTPAQQKVEAALRRARARQQERRELEKAIEAQLYRSGTVEKDW
ncbi:MAG: hypothetical protein JXM70_15695 [Pirellulales bacterium]|nr:hypothetical protein [Pirellulales bacterium]